MNFPDYQTDIEVIDKATNEKIGYLYIENDYIKPNIIILINSANVTSYQFSESLLVYKVNNGRFKGVTIDFIQDEKPEANTDLIITAKALVAKNEWKWIKVCGSFLIKADDSEIKELLEGYALGQFTPEELE